VISAHALRERSPQNKLAAMHSNLLMAIFERLYDRYGQQGWWPGDTKFEIAVGAILTQAISWTGVEKALSNLQSAGVFSMDGLNKIPQDDLARLLRPCLYYNVKARKLKAFVEHTVNYYNSDLDVLLAREPQSLRRELLSIYGIGEETADDILLYAAGQPFFVIDAYTRRILIRLGMAPKLQAYEAYQELFHRSLPNSTRLFNEYHALLDRHAKETCRKKPLCTGCCILDLCHMGQQNSTQA
jgi:endonuclease-3 related protein